MDIPAILTRRYKGSEWALEGDDYTGLTWLSDSPKPTEEELVSLWPEVQAEIAAEAQAKIDAKKSAVDKLANLGLTPEEVKELFGIEI